MGLKPSGLMECRMGLGCLCVCVHICIHTYMYVCMDVCMHVRVCMYMYVFKYVRVGQPICLFLLVLLCSYYISSGMIHMRVLFLHLLIELFLMQS